MIDKDLDIPIVERALEHKDGCNRKDCHYCYELGEVLARWGYD